MSLAQLTVPGSRANGVVGFALIGGSIAAFGVTTASFGGWLFAPVQLPQCFDVTRPSTLSIALARGAGAIDNVGLAALLLNVTIARPLAVTNLAVLQQTFTPPLNWLVDQPTTVTLDVTPGVTFPANTFLQADFVGIALGRNGPAPIDTYANQLLFPGTLLWTYTSRCKLSGCL